MGVVSVLCSFRRLLTVVLFYGMVSAIFFDGLDLEVMDWRENGI